MGEAQRRQSKLQPGTADLIFAAEGETFLNDAGYTYSVGYCEESDEGDEHVESCSISGRDFPAGWFLILLLILIVLGGKRARR
jgi:hypothetical protein